MRLLSFFLFLISFTAIAQTGPINIHLKSGEVVATRYVYFYSGYKSYLRVHEKKGEKIAINLVDHVEGPDEKGNQRYFKPVQSGNVVWGERGFTSDRILIYHTDIMLGTMAANYKPKSCLYSKDGGPLLPLKRKYLKKDLADCPVSMEYLKKAKMIGAGQAAISIVSYSLIIAGFIDVSKETTPDAPGEDSGPNIPPTILIGVVGAWIPFFMTNAKREKYLDALKVYQ